eukprot:TRINITY_DN20434_c0_g1_i1.p1 TRINITY_DN20434_c0_g1~~TRINITY_DN20434_c0_g1_i1.p1  ORF type:complete len:411 (+),score=68.97 TRINITY_DN20434_c0_g1_i1:102-1334(+)
MLTNPQDIRMLLYDHNDHFEKVNLFAQFPTLKKVFGQSLVVVAGDKWKTQRKAIEPSFTYAKLKTLVPFFAKLVGKLSQKVEQKLTTKTDGKILMGKYIRQMTLDAIGLAGFSQNFGSLDGNPEMKEILAAHATILSSIFDPIAIFLPFTRKLPTTRNQRIAAAFEKMDTFLFSMIQQHREDKGSGRDKDLLDHLLSNPAVALPDQELRDNLYLFFIAGHDTSSSALSSALYFLAKDHVLQERLYNEVKGVDIQTISVAELKKLVFLGNVLREALRLHSPAALISARAVKQEGGVDIGGYHVPKGVSVAVALHAVMMDERIWKDPTKFDPDRYLTIKGDLNVMMPAFSAGPRICVGKRFAEIEMQTALVHLIQSYSFDVISPDYKWKIKPNEITLQPADDLPLKVTCRHQ